MNCYLSGKRRRIQRLFRHSDDRAILTPVDHGVWYGPVDGIEDVSRITNQLVSNSDGLLMCPGLARAVSHTFPSDCALALRLGAATAQGPIQDYEALFAGVETALRLDADAVVHTLYLGSERDMHAINDLGMLIESCGRYEVPVIAEFLPAHEEWTPLQVAHWARLGFELGADVIKTIYTGDVDSFHRVVKGCPIPILVAGGPPLGSMVDLLKMVDEAIQAGAAGTAIGRRVWQANNPSRLLEVIGKVIHQTISLEAAVEIAERIGE